MGEWLAVVAAVELFGADRLPVVVDGFGWIVWELVEWEFEVFCPESTACAGGEFGVVGDDVHLGVVEERVLVPLDVTTVFTAIVAMRSFSRR